MPPAAIILVADNDRRRLLAQRIGTLNLFDRIYVCATLPELINLLDHGTTGPVFCEGVPVDHQASEWSDLVRQGRCRIICFVGPGTPRTLRLPVGSCYLDPAIDNTDLIRTITALERQPLGSPPPVSQPSLPTGSTDHQRIYSRFYFDTFVGKELSRSRLTGRPVSLLLLEPQLVDPRQEAELLEPLLSRIAVLIRDRIRSSDLICRYEHRRLAILLPETTPKQAEELLERILVKLNTLLPEEHTPWSWAVVSPARNDVENAHSLLQKALALLEKSPPKP